MTAVATDTDFMDHALRLADEAAAIGEVPVGALVVSSEGEVLGEGINRRETTGDPTGHAELLALRRAAEVVGNWRLCGTTLYVTLEPCPMCAGALVNARVARLVYGCDDPKAGAIRSLFSIADDPRLNHRLEVTSGVKALECARALSQFFAQLRR